MFNRDTAMRQLIAKLLIIKQEENREKIEKILTNLVKEMERQGIIEVDKKEIESNFKNAREYEIEQMLEKIEEDYTTYINKQY